MSTAFRSALHSMDVIIPPEQSFSTRPDASNAPDQHQRPHPELPPAYPQPETVDCAQGYVRIFRIRHELAVVDKDLADLYETTIDAVNKAVMRNACCFPRNICFRLSNAEFHYLQNRTNLGIAERGNWLCAPLVFTNEGALAVSKIINTFSAIRGSVLIWHAIHKLQTAGAFV